MNYTIEPSKDRTHIILTVVGEINRQVATEKNIEAHLLGKELEINRYLVDVTQARNTDTPMDSYQFAYSDMQKGRGIDTGARIAVLVSPGDHSHDFIETVTRNAGLHVKIFTDLQSARQYLVEE